MKLRSSTALSQHSQRQPVALAVFAIVTVLPTFLTPVPATASPEAAQLAQGVNIEIDGPPVTVELESWETAQFTYDYDGIGRVLIEIVDCPGGEFLTGYYLKVQMSYLSWMDGHRACGVDDQAHGPFAPEGPSGNWFELTNTSPDTRSVTLGLTRVPQSSAPITSGQPVAVELPRPPGDGIPNETARWFHFSAAEGQRIRFEFDGWEECPAAALRFPDLTTPSPPSISGFCAEGDEWPTFTIPQTGTYRVELSNFWFWSEADLSGTVELTSEAAPTCRDTGVMPIMLVHGFNQGHGKVVA